jgi:hypothetical protein
LFEKSEVLVDLAVDRGLETVVIEFQIAAPAIKVFRIVVLRGVVVVGRRRQVFAIVAL